MVLWRDGEVPAFVRGLVAEIAAGLIGAGVPRCFLGVDAIEAVAGSVLVLDGVEEVELRLGAVESRVGDAGALQVSLGFGRDLPGIAGVRLVGEGVDDRMRDDQSLRLTERIDVGGGDIGEQFHVGLVDALEACDGGPVEEQTFGDLLRAV